MKEHFSYCIKGCVRCCTDRGNPLELTLEDILRLCHYLSIDATVFFERYCEIIWNRIPDTSLLIPSVGLIFPCRFLDGDKCTIYDVRPIHCRLFPEALIVENADLSLYRNCGYQCIDKGIRVDKSREPYIYELKKTDSVELEATASYFENFRYCVEIGSAELERVSSLLKDTDEMEKAEKRRELLTETVSRKTCDEVRYAFMDKLETLNTEFREKGMHDISYTIK